MWNIFIFFFNFWDGYIYFIFSFFFFFKFSPLLSDNLSFFPFLSFFESWQVFPIYIFFLFYNLLLIFLKKINKKSRFGDWGLGLGISSFTILLLSGIESILAKIILIKSLITLIIIFVFWLLLWLISLVLLIIDWLESNLFVFIFCFKYISKLNISSLLSFSFSLLFSLAVNGIVSFF